MDYKEDSAKQFLSVPSDRDLQGMFKFNKIKLVFEFDKSELVEGLNGFLIKGY